MHRQHRRIVGSFMAVCALYATIGPTIVLAAEVRAARGAYASSTTEAVTLFDKSGRADARFVGNGYSARLVAMTRAARSIPPARWDSVHSALTRIVERPASPRTLKAHRAAKEALALLEALVSPDVGAFHEAVKKLPVTVTTWEGVDALGRPGIHTRFQHVSGRAMEMFRVINRHVPEVESLPSIIATEAQKGDELSSLQPSSLTLSKADFCEYTDDENVYFSGDCATQQEIEDAAAYSVATEATAAEVDEEVNDHVGACTWDEQRELYLCVPWGGLSSMPSPGSSAAVPTDVLADAASVNTPASAAMTIPAEARVPNSCGDNIIAYGSALAVTGFRFWKLKNVFQAAAPPAAAITEAVFWTGIAIAAVAGTAIALHDCLDSNHGRP